MVVSLFVLIGLQERIYVFANILRTMKPPISGFPLLPGSGRRGSWGEKPKTFENVLNLLTTFGARLAQSGEKNRIKD